MNPVTIVAIGEPMIEFNQISNEDRSYRQGFGGDTSNSMIAAARQGATSAYITRVGDDEFGAMFRALWDEEGVDTSGVITDAGASTGAYFVTHHEEGHRFSYLRAGSAASRLAPADLNPQQIAAAGILHVSAISQAISVSACDAVFAAIDIARGAGVKVTYDSNLRLRLWPLARARAILRETVALTDYFLPSLEDMQTITGRDAPDAILDWCFAAGAREVVLKLGKDGVMVANPAGRIHIAGNPVKAVDATGAGDCFAGAFLARLSKHDGVEAAARYANAAAALTTTGYGAVAPIPRESQVLDFLRGVR